jgi:hypothetical protein
LPAASSNALRQAGAAFLIALVMLAGLVLVLGKACESLTGTN